MSLLNGKVQSTRQAGAGANRRFDGLGACFRAWAEGDQGLISPSAEVRNRAGKPT